MSAWGKLKDKVTGSSSSTSTDNKGMDKLASNDEEFKQLKQKEEEEQRRKAEYEKLDLANRTTFGTGHMKFG